MFRRALLVLLAAAFLWVLVACGGGGGTSSESSSGGAEPSEQSDIGDAASAEPPAEPEESGPGAEDAAGPPGNVDGESSAGTPAVTFTGEGSESFCSQMTEIQAAFESAEPSEATYSELATRLAGVSPPPELAADWPFFVEMNNALAADPTGETLSGESGDENVQRLGEVSTRVSEYMSQVCDL